jgi:hypothetical protein
MFLLPVKTDSKHLSFYTADLGIAAGIATVVLSVYEEGTFAPHFVIALTLIRDRLYLFFNYLGKIVRLAMMLAFW